MKSEATHNKVQKFLFFIFIFSNEEALIIKKNDKIIDQAHKFSKKKKKDSLDYVQQSIQNVLILAVKDQFFLSESFNYTKTCLILTCFFS